MSAMSRTRTRLDRSTSGPLLLAALLLLGFASASAAREVTRAAPGSPSCQHAHVPDEVAASAATATPDTASPIKPSAKQDAGADAVTGGRLQTPRWHSFLPGMFR